MSWFKKTRNHDYDVTIGVITWLTKLLNDLLFLLTAFCLQSFFCLLLVCIFNFIMDDVSLVYKG